MESDFITLHVPLTRETHHLFNAKTIAQMKPTAYLVNTSRGPVVDEAALAEALKSGKIAGAALDVFEFEPKVSPELVGAEKCRAHAAHRQRLARNPHENGDDRRGKRDRALRRPPPADASSIPKFCQRRTRRSSERARAGRIVKDIAQHIFRATLAAIDIPETMECKLDPMARRCASTASESSCANYHEIVPIAYGKAALAMAEGLDRIIPSGFARARNSRCAVAAGPSHHPSRNWEIFSADIRYRTSRVSPPAARFLSA